MANEVFRVWSDIRGPGLFDRAGLIAHKALKAGQPLILEREPSNPVDTLAVKLLTLHGEPVGYVMRPLNGEVARRLDTGEILLAKVETPALPASPGRFRVAEAVIWSEGSTIQGELYEERNVNPCRELFDEIYGR